MRWFLVFKGVLHRIKGGLFPSQTNMAVTED